MVRLNFVYGVSRFRPHRCIQCIHFFDEHELFSDWSRNVLKPDYSETIICPLCGFENPR
jgi:rubredoxin